MKKSVWFYVMLAVGVLLASCGGGGGSDDDDATPVAERDGSVVEVPGFVKVEGGTVVGGDKYTVIDPYNQETHISRGAFVAGRTVTISSFYICEHEVTQGEYEKYCSYGRYHPNTTNGENCPVYHVSWYDTLVYCNKRSIAEGLTPCYRINGATDPDEWGSVPTDDNAVWNSASCDFTANGYRLPTEVEWEYAARGGASGCAKENPNKYAGCNDSESLEYYAWYPANSNQTTHEVKAKRPNELNLYDMTGNVSEWCWDVYNSGIDNATPSTGPVYEFSNSSRARVTVIHITVPKEIDRPTNLVRAARGGSFFHPLAFCPISNRHNDGRPHLSFSMRGFRLVRSSL